MQNLFIFLQIINPIIAIASFVFAGIILARRNDKIYFNFGMSALFLGLWLVATEVMHLPIELYSRSFIVNLTFLFGLLILHYFTIFTYYFPYRNIEGVEKRVKLLYLLSMVIAITTLIPTFYTYNSVLNYPFLRVDINMFWLLIYSLYFFFLVALSYKNMIQKFLRSDGIHRINLRKVIVAFSIAILFNLIFSIGIYFFTDFDTNLIGSIFTFSIIIMIYSILYSK